MARGVHTFSWPDSLAESVSSGFNERLCLKKIKWERKEVKAQYFFSTLCVTTHTLPPPPPQKQKSKIILRLSQDVCASLSTVHGAETAGQRTSPVTYSVFFLAFWVPASALPLASRIDLALALPHIALNQEDGMSGPQSCVSFFTRDSSSRSQAL